MQVNFDNVFPLAVNNCKQRTLELHHDKATFAPKALGDTNIPDE